MWATLAAQAATGQCAFVAALRLMLSRGYSQQQYLSKSIDSSGDDSVGVIDQEDDSPFTTVPLAMYLLHLLDFGVYLVRFVPNCPNVSSRRSSPLTKVEKSRPTGTALSYGARAHKSI